MKTHPAIAVALVLASCSDNGHPPSADTTLPGGDLTIEIHRQFPFVDGDTADDATFVAVQDGDGPFVAATGQNGLYRVHITNDRYGIAVGCRDTGINSIEIVQRVIADGTRYDTICKSTPATATLDITVKNLPANQKLRIRTPSSITQLSADGTDSLTVPPGQTEVFGTIIDANRNILKLIRKSVDVQNKAAITLDVAVDAIAPETGTLTLSPAEPTATVRTAVSRPYGSVGLQPSTGAVLGTPARYFMMPAALRQPDDLYRITVTGSTGTVTHIVKSPLPLAFTLPKALQAEPATLVKTPFLHPIWTFTPTAAGLPIQSFEVQVNDFIDANASTFRLWFSTLSSAWIAGASTIRYEFPDLSTMPGFADFALRDRARLDATIVRNEASAATAGDGGETTSSSTQNTIGEFCGDGAVQAGAGEACDPGAAGESATCNDDCTVAKCGDGKVNATAGEECDPPDDTTCSATCTNIQQ